MKVAVLGGGSWGTTVASLVARNTDTILWGRDEATVAEVNERHTNEKYLAGVKLTASLRASASLPETVAWSDIVVMGIPSQSFRSVAMQVKEHVRPWIPIVSLTKGLEEKTHLRMTQVLSDVLPGHRIGVLSGPNLAREIASGFAAASVIAMDDEPTARQLQPYFRTGLFRVYTSPDVVGCELGGAFKNVVAIAVGMGDGAGAGENTRATLITRGLTEIKRLGVAMGGEAETFSGLTGMGDLVATCTSARSRNYHVGRELGRGRTLADIVGEMHMVAEGVKTVKTVIELARKYRTEMPIAHEVYKVLYEDSTARRAFRGLLRREEGSEFSAQG